MFESYCVTNLVSDDRGELETLLCLEEDRHVVGPAARITRVDIERGDSGNVPSPVDFLEK